MAKDKLEALRAAVRAAESKPEKLRLPESGVEITVRRPSPNWFLAAGRMPSSLAAIVQGRQYTPTGQEKPNEETEWLMKLLGKTIVEPREILDQPDELLTVKDRDTIVGYAYGIVTVEKGGEVVDLESFRDKPSATASVTRAGGRRILSPAV